jgi:hypothetical protein
MSGSSLVGRLMMGTCRSLASSGVKKLGWMNAAAA